MNIKESCGIATSAEFLVRVFVRKWLGTGTVVGQVAVPYPALGYIEMLEPHTLLVHTQ